MDLLIAAQTWLLAQALLADALVCALRRRTPRRRARRRTRLRRRARGCRRTPHVAAAALV